MTDWLEGRIVERRRWTERLHTLRFEAPLGEFRAGQFTRVALDLDGERVGRPYSLVNAPDERPLEIYFNEVPEGPLSPRLSTLEPGDRLWVDRSPRGFFTLDEVPDAEQLWLFSTGTALGVFLSLLKTDEPWQRFRDVVLVQGVRQADELTYDDTLARIASRHTEQFTFVPVLSREQRPGTLHGRIPPLLADGSLEEAINLRLAPERAQIMLCGNQGMITDASEHLKERGFRRNRRSEPGHITTEKYW